MEITPEIQELLDKQKADLEKTFEEQTAGLKESQQKLLAEKKAQQEEKERAAAEAEKARLEKAAKDKDIDTLTESFNEKIKTLQEQNEQLTNGIKQSQIGDLASAFVEANIVDDPFSRQAMKEVYAKRLDLRDGKPVVLDAEGNLTALTIEDLDKEIKASSIYSGHIRSSKASGGGVGGGGGNPGGAGAKPNLNGNVSEQAAALATKIPGLSDLPLK